MKRSFALLCALLLGSGCQVILGIEDGTPQSGAVGTGSETGDPVDTGSTMEPPDTGSETGGRDDTGGTDTGGTDTGGDGDGDSPFFCEPFRGDCETGSKCGLRFDFGLGDFVQDCVPEGTGLDNDPCEYDFELGVDNCAIGLACAPSVDADASFIGGLCRPMCGFSATFCLEEEVCSIAGLPVDICLQRCDPVAQNCPAEFACYPAGDSLCAGTAANLPAGAACDGINECARGLACAPDFDTFEPSCQVICDHVECTDPQTGAPNACGCGGCGPDEVCFQEGADFGLCRLAEAVDCDCSSSPACGGP